MSGTSNWDSGKPRLAGAFVTDVADFKKKPAPTTAGGKFARPAPQKQPEPHIVLHSKLPGVASADQTGLFVHASSRTGASNPMQQSGPKKQLEPVPFSLAQRLASESSARASASLCSLDPELDLSVSESLADYCDSQLSSLTLEKEALLQKQAVLEGEIAEMSRGLEKKAQSVLLVEEALKRDQDALERFNSDIARLKEAIYSGNIYLGNLRGKKHRLAQALLDLDEEDKRLHRDLYEQLEELRRRKLAAQQRAEQLAEETRGLREKLQAKQEVFELGDQQRRSA